MRLSAVGPVQPAFGRFTSTNGGLLHASPDGYQALQGEIQANLGSRAINDARLDWHLYAVGDDTEGATHDTLVLSLGLPGVSRTGETPFRLYSDEIPVETGYTPQFLADQLTGSLGDRINAAQAALAAAQGQAWSDPRDQGNG